MSYLALKTLHILAVAIFVGNITTGVMWKFHADHSGDPRLMAHALAGIIRSDRWFTLPGVVLIVATGIALAVIAGYPLLRTFWIAWGIALFALSGVLFQVWVAPMQRRLLAVASAAEFDSREYGRLSRIWAWSGAAALAAPLMALALMVIKPTGF